MLIADEYVDLTQSTREIEPAHGHTAAVEEPDYDLAIFRVTADHVLQRVRVVHISRVTMLPYQQDIFDDEGPDCDAGDLCELCAGAVG